MFATGQIILYTALRIRFLLEKSLIYWKLMPRRNPTLQNTEEDTLDARAQAVLAAVIKEHLITGDAVGSLRVGGSLRGKRGLEFGHYQNVMAELEDAGLVEQPHTSAGRVPTDQGYRYYVDKYLEEAKLSRADLRAIERSSRRAESVRQPRPTASWRRCHMLSPSFRPMWA